MFIPGYTQPVTEHGKGPGAGPVGASSNGQIWLRDSPSAGKDCTECSLRLFLSNPSFPISFPGPALWCESSPCLLLPTSHLTFTEISLNKSSAHLILSWHLLLRGPELTTSNLSGRVRKIFQRVQKFQVQQEMSLDSINPRSHIYMNYYLPNECGW